MCICSEVLSEYMQTASEVVSEMFQYLNDVTLCVVFVYLGMMCVVFVYLVSSEMPDGVPSNSLKRLSIDTCKSL